MNTAPSNPTYKWNSDGKVTEVDAKPADKNTGTGTINHCRKGGMMSECGLADKTWKEHIGCKFSIKASNANRCMFNVMGENCDCLKAQMDN